MSFSFIEPPDHVTPHQTREVYLYRSIHPIFRGYVFLLTYLAIAKLVIAMFDGEWALIMIGLVMCVLVSWSPLVICDFVRRFSDPDALQLSRTHVGRAMLLQGEELYGYRERFLTEDWYPGKPSPHELLRRERKREVERLRMESEFFPRRCVDDDDYDYESRHLLSDRLAFPSSFIEMQMSYDERLQLLWKEQITNERELAERQRIYLLENRSPAT